LIEKTHQNAQDPHAISKLADSPPCAWITGAAFALRSPRAVVRDFQRHVDISGAPQAAALCGPSSSISADPSSGHRAPAATDLTLGDAPTTDRALAALTTLQGRRPGPVPRWREAGRGRLRRHLMWHYLLWFCYANFAGKGRMARRKRGKPGVICRPGEKNPQALLLVS
jgi:hypothetical protein